MKTESLLQAAIQASFDDLLPALELQRLGNDRFRFPPESAGPFGRIYGGLLLAQALLAAADTVSGLPPSSLHAAFVKAGTPGRHLDLVVDRTRDGRSMSTRQVTVVEDDRPLLVAIVSFHDNGSEPNVASPPPPVVAPHDMPLVQHWAQRLPPETGHHGRHWIEYPPPLELRIGEAPAFLGGLSTTPTRSHWMRVPRPLGDDPLLHSALVAYASDLLLLDMVFRAHPAKMGPGRSNGFSLDHAIWFHRPTKFDLWHLYTQEALAVVGDRGLARGTIHDADGRLVASVLQEDLVRPVSAP